MNSSNRQTLAAKTLKSKDKKQAGKRLVSWFQKNARDLPWRKKKTPYRIWLSEMMLQQTQVDTVIPYFLRFTQKWPKVTDLANSQVDQVLRQWEGLGYYSRARNLHKTAQLIVSDYDQTFPKTPEALRKLPGIGPYSAGAIASLAYNIDTPAIDGNVCRVMGRFLAKKIIAAQIKDRDLLENEILEMIPKNQAGIFNEALMELGATVCTPRNPQCPKCPLKTNCRAFFMKKQEDFPGKPRKVKVREERIGVTIILNKNQVLLKQNPDKGLLAGLWGFPNFLLPKDKLCPKQAPTYLQKKIKAELNLSTKTRASLEAFQHRLTHINMFLFPYIFETKNPETKKIKKKEETYGWVSIKKLSDKGLSKAHRKIADLLGPF